MKKSSHIFFLGLLAIIFIAVPLLTITGTHSSVSFYEQRSLAPMPTLSSTALLDGTYFSDVDSFLSDHLGVRDKLLKADTNLNLRLGKPNVNGLIVNSEALLDFHGYSRWDLTYLKSDSSDKAQKYRALQDSIEAYGGYFCYLGLPLQSTYYASCYPEYTDNRLWHTTAIRENFSQAMNAENIAFINMYDTFEDLEFPKEYYYETDHHFTLLGAHVAYSTLLDHLQASTDFTFSNYALSDFDWHTLENPFLGSSNRKLYGLWSTGDAVQIAYPKQNIAFTRTDNGVPVDSKLYSIPASINDNISYSVYMGGDIGQTVINTNRPDRPNILIYGDSFTNPIEAMLWTQANELHCLDFRYYNQMDLTSYIKEHLPDIVICVRDETTYLSESGNGITS